jgi:hypothetical protein
MLQIVDIGVLPRVIGVGNSCIKHRRENQVFIQREMDVASLGQWQLVVYQILDVS